MLAGLSIFVKGDLEVWNPDPYLIQIRQGLIPYEDLMARTQEIKTGLAKRGANSSLPAEVPKGLITELTLRIFESKLGIKI